MSSANADGHRRWSRRLERIRRRRSVILGYHGLGRSPIRSDLSRLQVSPARFRAQIGLLVEAGFTFLTVAELVRLAGGGEPPPGYAAISFDDGMRSVFTVALPILHEHRIRATVYVTVGLLGGVSPWIGAGENRIMGERELKELANEGWELGAHTVTHPDLSALDYEACRREIEGSQATLERISGVPVQTLAYPFGRYGSASVQASRDSGLIAAVTTGGANWDPFQLPRAMPARLDPMPVFLLKLEGRYEPLLASPPVSLLRRGSVHARAWTRQAVRRATASGHPR